MLGKQRINSVSDKRHGEMNVMAVKEGQWERIQVTVDSGAMRNVFPKNVAQAFVIEESAMSKAGINFVAANDTVIKNYGSRKILGMTEGWNNINFQAHVADVIKPLASVVDMEECGMRVVFENGAGYIQSIHSGRKVNLYRDGREYKFDIWVPAQNESPSAQAATRAVTVVKNQFSALSDDAEGCPLLEGENSDGEFAKMGF